MRGRGMGMGVGAICLTLAGCAGLEVKPVANDTKAHGFRYYQTAPFLFVRSDGKGGLTSEIVYLPDDTLTMSARPYAIFAINDTTLSFTNGTLGEAKMVADETAVPTAFLDAVSKAAVAAIAANVPATSGPSVPTPYLFKVVVKGTQVQLLGGPAQRSPGLDALNTQNAAKAAIPFNSISPAAQ